MKLKNLILCLAAVFCLTLPVQAATYSIDWYKVAGGGGISTGGVYTISGTAGQPDAGTMTGGNYALVGGYWSLVAAVPNQGVPQLFIKRTATNTVLVYWDSPSTGFILQQTASLKPTNWVNVVQTPLDDGTTKSVVVNPPVGNLYFRLQK